jgi:hypothetical protein
VLAPSEHDGKATPSDTSPREDDAPSESAAFEVTQPGAVRAFGAGAVSERPLDDVILGYLIENARKRRAKS